MKVPIIVSCSLISFSSSEFVIGHLPFVLVIRVGLFVSAFSSNSQKCLESSKVSSETRKTKHVYNLAVKLMNLRVRSSR